VKTARRSPGPLVLVASLALPLVLLAAQPKVDPLSIANLWMPGDPGERLYIQGRVLSSNGTPLEGAQVNVRQADGAGEYREHRYRGAVRTAEDGSYQLNTVLPGQEHGVKHIHLTVTHEFHKAVTTEILFKGDPNLNPATEREVAIPLETAQSQGEPILFGNFEVVMEPRVGN
jgi:protocatechuate 3,4-dioxygenase beta subunit